MGNKMIWSMWRRNKCTAIKVDERKITDKEK